MFSIMVSVTVSNDRPNGDIQARGTLRNLQTLPRFQRLCERYGIQPTYFLSYPVLKPPHIQWFQEAYDRQSCELGIFFQPWATPPFAAHESRLVETTPSDCSPSTVRAKLKYLHSEFTAANGFSPRLHRAEGGGLSSACLQTMESLKLEVDASAFPGMGPSNGLGTDWHSAPRVAYHPSLQSPANRGHSKVIELPYTTGPKHPPLGLLRKVTSYLPRWLPVDSIVSHALLKTEQCPLDPCTLDSNQLGMIADITLAAGLPYLHLTVRSEHLHPGESRGNLTNAMTEKRFEKIDQFLRYAVDRLRAAPTTLSDYARQHCTPGTPA